MPATKGHFGAQVTWTTERIRKLEELYYQDLPYSEIARAMGLKTEKLAKQCILRYVPKISKKCEKCVYLRRGKIKEAPCGYRLQTGNARVGKVGDHCASYKKLEEDIAVHQKAYDHEWQMLSTQFIPKHTNIRAGDMIEIAHRAYDGDRITTTDIRAKVVQLYPRYIVLQLHFPNGSTYKIAPQYFEFDKIFLRKLKS